MFGDNEVASLDMHQCAVRHFRIMMRHALVQRSSKMYSISEAAKATGKSKSTILRAAKNGKISGIKNDDGEWELQPVDVHKRYPMLTDGQSDLGGAHQTNDAPRTTDDALELESEIRELRAKLDAKDEVVKAHEGTITDLRDRLDQEGVERRQLTAMLTDQRNAPSESLDVPRKGLLARVFG